MEILQFALLWATATLFVALKAFDYINDFAWWVLFIGIMVILGLPVVLAVIALFAGFLLKYSPKYGRRIYGWLNKWYYRLDRWFEQRNNRQSSN